MAVFGEDPLDSGEIYLHGKKVEIKSPMHAVRWESVWFRRTGLPRVSF